MQQYQVADNMCRLYEEHGQQAHDVLGGAFTPPTTPHAPPLCLNCLNNTPFSLFTYIYIYIRKVDVLGAPLADLHSPGDHPVVPSEILDMMLDDCEMQLSMAVAQSLVETVEAGALTPSAQVACLLPMTLRVIKSQKDMDVVDAWLAVLYALCPAIPPAAVERDLCTLAMSKGRVEEAVDSRATCCRILGAAATRLNRAAVERIFFSRAMELCQDTDYQVRVAMCDQIVAVARAVGPEVTLRAVAPELDELCRDEEQAGWEEGGWPAGPVATAAHIYPTHTQRRAQRLFGYTRT